MNCFRIVTLPWFHTTFLSNGRKGKEGIALLKINPENLEEIKGFLNINGKSKGNDIDLVLESNGKFKKAGEGLIKSEDSILNKMKNKLTQAKSKDNGIER